jgi:Xaa-Pro aminopeptidase
MKILRTEPTESICIMVFHIIWGVDVHDLGTRTEPIKAGMVFTVEPGIYIEEEQMGVRIENNVWITRNGNKDLMKNIPITVEEIEALMKR